MLSHNDYKKAFDAMGADADNAQHEIFERCSTIAELTVTASDCLKAGIAAAEYFGKDADVAATMKKKIKDIKAAEQRIKDYNSAIEKAKELDEENAGLSEENCELRKRIDKLEYKRDSLELAADMVVPQLVEYVQSGIFTRLGKVEFTDEQIKALRTLDVLS